MHAQQHRYLIGSYYRYSGVCLKDLIPVKARSFLSLALYTECTECHINCRSGDLLRNIVFQAVIADVFAHRFF